MLRPRKFPVGRGGCGICATIRVFYAECVDIGFARASDEAMAAFRLNAKRPTSRIAVAALVCLLLSEALSFVITTTRHGAFSNADGGASIAAAGDYCDARPENGGRLPAHSNDHSNCALCIVSDRDPTFDAIALVASAIATPPPGPHDVPSRFDMGDVAASPLGWTGSWSSRAPPRFS